jgi:acyl carrier protein
MELRNIILRAFSQALEKRHLPASGDLTDDMVLLDSGLDSLGFAVLVVILEEELGYDPFSVMDEAKYPTTFGEFVTAYQQFSPTDLSFR